MDKDQKPVGQQRDNREFFSNELLPRIERWKLKGNAEADAIICLHACVLEIDPKSGNVATRTQAAVNGSENAIYYGMIEVADNMPLFKMALMKAAKYFQEEEKQQMAKTENNFVDALKKAGIEVEKIGTVIIETGEDDCPCPHCIAKRAANKNNPNVN